MPLFIPPLRERREDILPLALDMMQKFNKELKKNFVGFTPAAAELLTELSVAGQHPRAAQRDRAHHDPLQGKRDRRGQTCRKRFATTTKRRPTNE